MNIKKFLLILVLILIFGFFSFDKISSFFQGESPLNNKINFNSEEIPKLNPISESDHIMGNPNADIIIVEYADFECPYCKEFQKTMDKIMDLYGKKGEVAWVFRHFPIVESHPNAMEAAIASECVAEIRGQESFWRFADVIFSISNLTSEKIDLVVKNFGISEEEYGRCKNSNHHKVKIERDIADGDKLYEFENDFGTPYNIIFSKNGTSLTVMGSLPLENMVEIIDSLKSF